MASKRRWAGRCAAAVWPVVAIAPLAALAACGGASPTASPTTPPGSVGAVSLTAFSGDPCQLLTASDLAKLTKPATVVSAQKPQPTNCLYVLSTGPISLWVDRRDDFDVQKGEADPSSTRSGPAGLGQRSWLGNFDGVLTLDVETAKLSFRMSGLGEGDLATLANAVLAKLA